MLGKIMIIRYASRWIVLLAAMPLTALSQFSPEEELAELYGGELTLSESEQGGVKAELRLPKV